MRKKTPRRRSPAKRKHDSKPLFIQGQPVVLAFVVRNTTLEGKGPVRIVGMAISDTCRFTDLVAATSHLAKTVSDRAANLPDLPSEVRLKLGATQLAAGEAFSFLPGAQRLDEGTSSYSSPAKRPL